MYKIFLTQYSSQAQPIDLCWLIICYLLAICMSFLGKISIYISAHFLIKFCFLQLGCMSSLYMLIINPLSDVWFANIFSHSLCCLFFCWWFPLMCRSFFSLMQSHLFLLPLFLVWNPKSHHQNQCQGAYHLCFILGILWFKVSCPRL